MAWGFLLLLSVSFAEAIQGDLNKDGKVDFDDFFILADNFGKSGQTSEDCNSSNTPLTGSIPNLAYFDIWTLYSSGDLAKLEVKNWDSDAEYDGVTVHMFYYDKYGQFVFWGDEVGSEVLNVTVQANVRFYVAAGSSGDEQQIKKSTTPYCDFEYTLTRSSQEIFVPFEVFTENVDAADVRVSSNGLKTVLSIVEVHLNLADGTHYDSSAKRFVTLK